MTEPRKIIAVEVTKILRIAPDEERARFAQHFKGKSLARLNSLVYDMEAGRFYEAARTYYKECTKEEREAVDFAMTEIFEGIGTREVNKKAWSERQPGHGIVRTDEGHLVDGRGLDYPKYALGSIRFLGATRPLRHNVHGAVGRQPHFVASIVLGEHRHVHGVVQFGHHEGLVEMHGDSVFSFDFHPVHGEVDRLQAFAFHSAAWGDQIEAQFWEPLVDGVVGIFDALAGFVDGVRHNVFTLWHIRCITNIASVGQEAIFALQA